MQINSITNGINFNGLEYVNSPNLTKALKKQSPKMSKLLDKAAKEINEARIVVTFSDTGIMFHYVDMGDEGLTCINDAIRDKNILKVSGYTYDYEHSRGLRNTKYVRYTVALKNSRRAERFVRAINKYNKYPNSNEGMFAKALEVAKAIDEMV